MLRLCYKVLLCVVCCIPLLAQTQAAAATVEKEDTLHLPFFKRFSISTNAVDWVLATPNLGVEWDFSGSAESRFSILLNGKYNWNTHHSINPRIVYNVAGGNVEFRKYWRTGGPSGNPMPRYTKNNRDETVGLPRWGFQRFRRNVLSGRTFTDPRTWRAYYVGLYAGYEKFTYAFGRDGKQGDSFNFGVSGGWSVPLYPFKDGRSVDLDLGLALGAKMAAYDEFGYDEEYGCYTYKGTKGRHFLPYPVLQEARVSFVFRFRSIGKKVQGGAERYNEWDTRQLEKRAERMRKVQHNDSVSLADSVYKAALRAAEEQHRDSVRQARKLQDSLDDLAREQEKKLKEQETAAEESRKKGRRKGRKDGKAEEAEVKPAEAEAAPEADGPKESRKDKKRRRKAEKAEEAEKEQPVAYEQTAPPLKCEGKEGRV